LPLVAVEIKKVASAVRSGELQALMTSYKEMRMQENGLNLMEESLSSIFSELQADGLSSICWLVMKLLDLLSIIFPFNI
jgi:hypothetical protein